MRPAAATDWLPGCAWEVLFYCFYLLLCTSLPYHSPCLTITIPLPYSCLAARGRDFSIALPLLIAYCSAYHCQLTIQISPLLALLPLTFVPLFLFLAHLIPCNHSLSNDNYGHFVNTFGCYSGNLFVLLAQTNCARCDDALL